MVSKMKLKTLTLECTQLAQIPKGVKPFRSVVYHIKELFMNFLPPISINNSSKIELSFGPQGDEVLFDSVLGVTNVFIEDFNFEYFYKLSNEEQQDVILKMIVCSLSELSFSKNSDDSVLELIKEAAEKVIQCKYYLKQEVKHLKKISLDKKVSISVFRYLSAELGESWCCEIENKTDQSIEKVLMIEVPSYLDKRDYFKKPVLKNNTYEIYNRLSKSVFIIKL